jgi:hypothetical protein
MGRYDGRLSYMKDEHFLGYLLLEKISASQISFL